MKKIDKIHNKDIYNLTWSPDDSKILTVSADKTIKMWNVKK